MSSFAKKKHRALLLIFHDIFTDLSSFLSSADSL
jgi:hypothetical protein